METLKHHQWATTPPMGWNSWDCYGASVTEAEVIANAEYMAKHLKSFGWEYVVVDIQWYEPSADSSHYHQYVPLCTDEWSRLMPAVNRFPSAADGAGFKPLADRVHALGLKFGIHIMRGIPRQSAHADTPVIGSPVGARGISHPNSICPWNTDMYGLDPKHPGAQAYYDSLFALYAGWGVDYVKVDDIAASRLYQIHREEIAMIHASILKCGRPMVLSLSPGPAPLDFAAGFCENANLWRITDDYWDRWELLVDMFSRCERWYPIVGEGHWPDCDMLPLGHIGIRSVDGGGADRRTRFTPDEQLTMMTLWSIFRSPLMFGGELRDNDQWTNSLITNPEVLSLNQHSRANRPLPSQGAFRAWTAVDQQANRVLAVFNLGEEAGSVALDLAGLVPPGVSMMRDLWARKTMGRVEGSLQLTVPAHGARLVTLLPA